MVISKVAGIPDYSKFIYHTGTYALVYETFPHLASRISPFSTFSSTYLATTLLAGSFHQANLLLLECSVAQYLDFFSL